jgi:zinc transport system substrate-binding protein
MLLLSAAFFANVASGVDGIFVVATIEPIAGFAKEIGGERVRVVSLIPPGASPHTYEPKPSQIRDFSNADVLVKLGTNIEFENNWLGKLLAINKGVRVIDASQGIKLRRADSEDSHGGFDPHTWTSPICALQMAKNITRGLAEADPSHGEYYEQREEEFGRRLIGLDREIRERIAASGVKRFLVLHPAWGYFADEYGLIQVAIERRGREPSLGHLSKIIEMARREGIRVVIASPEHNIAGAQMVAREIKGTVVLISPLSRDYIDNLRRLTDAIVSGRAD